MRIASPCDRYDFVVAHLRAKYDIRVKRWRREMTGCAWQVRHADGHTIRWIEAPYPRTPISLAVFLHEIGHHEIGFESYENRCEEEYHAWAWALAEMKKLRVEPDARVLRRFDRSMQYAVSKAVRRGIKKLPEALAPFAMAA